MESNILFLSAPLVKRIWGGSYFKDVLHVTESDEKYGEMWTASALDDAMSYVTDGKFKGQSLKEVYENNRELFHSDLKEFPILVKVICAEDDLSVQVHPDDDYAKKVENGVGKTEGWLILDHAKDASIVIGHNARSKEELVSLVKEDNYARLLKECKVENGEFYPIPSGTIHAIKKGIVLLEIQQSCNITYRFYDYHRKDKNGNERELHVKKALEVTNIHPYDEKIVNCFKENITTIWKNKYFEVNIYDVNDSFALVTNEEYLVVSVAKGEINVEGKCLKLGDSFIILPDSKNVKISGNGKIVTTRSLL